MFKIGDKLLCIGCGMFFEPGKVYTCTGVNEKHDTITIAGFEQFGVFEEKRFILATDLNKALS